LRNAPEVTLWSMSGFLSVGTWRIWNFEIQIVTWSVISLPGVRTRGRVSVSVNLLAGTSCQWNNRVPPYGHLLLHVVE